MKKYVLIFLVLTIIVAGCKQNTGRNIISLNGIWQIEQSVGDKVPSSFQHSVQVPGLADIATPGFDSVGFPFSGRKFFWYRKTFVTSVNSEVATLKIHKARYGIKVFMNGKLCGEHFRCWTPAYFDVSGLLKPAGDSNEIIIRVGADINQLPDTVPYGEDWESVRYVPGLYDRVELIQSHMPYIQNAQLVPSVSKKSLRIVTEVKSGKEESLSITYQIKDAATDKVVYKGISHQKNIKAGIADTVDFTVEMPDCKLWTPEDPFLYKMQLSTGADDYSTRFGMRTFRFDSVSHLPLLNGKTYYLHGTNFALHRFFEDSVHGTMPWDSHWVRKLIRQAKAMNCNITRFHIGFAPEMWYEILDEEGMLVQDEYAIWGGMMEDKTDQKRCQAPTLIAQYTDWMRERWNHPCVVIWDAMNETVWKEGPVALNAVRHLDLSHRPWDCGWNEPSATEDIYEAHPYFYICYFEKTRTTKPVNGPLWDWMSKPQTPEWYSGKIGVPITHPDKHPILVNEYSWTWLFRQNGQTPFTDTLLYHVMVGRNSTEQQRRYFRAYALAAETEYWRSNRKLAGTMFFNMLETSRLGGSVTATAPDDMIDVPNVVFEPMLVERMTDALSPVGLMIDRWEDHFKAGQSVEFDVFAINDTYEKWTGQVELIVEGTAEISVDKKDCIIDPTGKTAIHFQIQIPKEKGDYHLKARLIYNGNKIESIRDFRIL